MRFSLSNPRSLAEWWRIWPERHGPALGWMAELHPEFAPQIREAWALINDETSLQRQAA